MSVVSEFKLEDSYRPVQHSVQCQCSVLLYKYKLKHKSLIISGYDLKSILTFGTGPIK